MLSTGEDNGKMDRGKKKKHTVQESWQECIQKATTRMGHCDLCPRGCGVNRLAGETGFCGIGALARVASWGLHPGEESVLVGEKGSGAIFFSGCNLGCVFCQNAEISTDPESGQEMDSETLAGIMLDLAAQGCANINLVTPSHVVPQIMAALALARKSGLTLPVVYNSSGYDGTDTLELLQGMVDIYMPDTKFWTRDSAGRYLGAPDYPRVMRRALAVMHSQVGDLVVDERGRAVRGLLVRHLVMPGLVKESRAILAFIAREISSRTWLNLMDQYHPCHQAAAFPELDRTPDPREIEQVRAHARHLGFDRIEERDLGRLLALLGLGARE